MLDIIFEALIGKYASISSGAFGILGAIAFAIPAFESRGLRDVLLQIEELERGISSDAFRNAKGALIREARRLLKRERNWNLLGAGLVGAAFLVLLMNATYCAVFKVC